MDRVELKLKLKQLGWSRAELSRRVGVHEVTAARWQVVPSPVAAYLELSLRVKVKMSEILL